MKPPGYTCPAIDRALHTARRALWRVRRIGNCPDDERDVDHLLMARLLLSNLLADLEVVREENRLMRASYYAMREQLRAAGLNVPTPPAYHSPEHRP